MYGKRFENGAFRNDDVKPVMRFSRPSSTPTQIQNVPVFVAFSNFSDVVWTEHILCVFRVKLSFFKLLRTGVNGATDAQTGEPFFIAGEARSALSVYV